MDGGDADALVLDFQGCEARYHRIAAGSRHGYYGIVVVERYLANFLSCDAAVVGNESHYVAARYFLFFTGIEVD